MPRSLSSSSSADSPSPALVLKRKRTLRLHRPPHPPATPEDEDTANCLILLAQGAAASSSFPRPKNSPGANFFLYECKTCSKCFPSFQALGGHRASHKKPKLAAPADAELSASTARTAVVAHEKRRTHECAICGSEFPSGQALGGHMRRHRQAAVMLRGDLDVDDDDHKKEKRVLMLDLNLPAPNDDDEVFVFAPPVVVAAAALVDCHY